MRTGAREMNDSIDKGRRTIELSEGEIDELEERRVPPVAVMAGVVAAGVGLGVLGWMIYRRRQRQGPIPQNPDAIPGYNRAPPGGVRPRPKSARQPPARARP